VRLLLDTHVWLWMIGEHERIDAETKRALTDPQTELFLSVASVWQIVIKHAAGKLKYTGQPGVQVPLHIERSGVSPLSISVGHALAAGALPIHHRDPFDRLIIAQAQVEELTLVTSDERFAAYDVPLMAVSG
jgi:PIN domain nuclease of toxin-antitoxin system